jgi:hypothetical protein
MKPIAWIGVVTAVLGATWSLDAVAQGAGAPPAQPQTGSTYVIRVRELNDRVEQLQEQLRRLQQRQRLLAESTATSGPVLADVELVDRTTSAYVVTGLRVWIDDALVYQRSDDAGALGTLKRVTAFHGPVSAGGHSVRVEAKLAGNGAVLPYMRAYHFEVRDEGAFTAIEGRPLALRLAVFERGGVTTPFDQRPAIAMEAR